MLSELQRREHARLATKRYREAHKEETAAYHAEYARTHREESNAKCRKYHAKHKEQDMARNKKWRQEHPTYASEVARIKRSGINAEEYNNWLDKQGGRCAICGEEPPDSRGLAVDHDHKTGKIRGLLCYRCNLGLGNFRDDTSLIQSAMIYLIKEKIQ